MPGVYGVGEGLAEKVGNPKDPAVLKIPMVIFIHYGVAAKHYDGSKKHYGGVSETPFFAGKT